MAQIAVKREGFAAIRETRTFERRATAVAWIDRREKELGEPGALAGAASRRRATLADAIDRYVAESRTEIRRTKGASLAMIKRGPLGLKPCARIGSVEIVEWATELGQRMKPSSVANHFAHLAAVFAIARPAWGYELDRQAVVDATAVCRRLGIIGKSRERDRRPTLDELDRLLGHFVAGVRKRPRGAPMASVVAFAVFSARRQEEITLLRWDDLDNAASRIKVRDMKDPERKDGNDQWCELPPEALRIIRNQPANGPLIFPYSTDAIGAAFTRACKLLGIDNLHFHDLRHEGVSRLFEMGLTIPQVAAVSGHRAWATLKRYSHMRMSGDKYAGWRWLELLAPERPCK